jgi:hypothetical protein
VPLPPIALYARLAEASFALQREIERLDDAMHTLALAAAWIRLDDVIEQLPAALAWDAQRQPQETTPLVLDLDPDVQREETPGTTLAQGAHAMTKPLESISHACAHCGTRLAASYPYAYCLPCQEHARCAHGVRYQDPCSHCDAESDRAYDGGRHRMGAAHDAAAAAVGRVTLQALIDALVAEYAAEDLRPVITRCVLRAYAQGVADTQREQDADRYIHEKDT